MLAVRLVTWLVAGVVVWLLPAVAVAAGLAVAVLRDADDWQADLDDDDLDAELRRLIEEAGQ